jgi:uncharacterized protein (TIGR02594 family)
MSKLLETFFRYYGQAEVSGPLSNAKILGIIQSVLPNVKDDSEAAWCGIFMAHVFRESGVPELIKAIPERFASAKSWASVGPEIPLSEAKPGKAIVVLHRGSPSDWRGHVGIYINHNAQNIWVAGGNQNNSVTISPYSSSRLFKVLSLPDIG